MWYQCQADAWYKVTLPSAHSDSPDLGVAKQLMPSIHTKQYSFVISLQYGIRICTEGSPSITNPVFDSPYSTILDSIDFGSYMFSQHISGEPPMALSREGLEQTRFVVRIPSYSHICPPNVLFRTIFFCFWPPSDQSDTVQCNQLASGSCGLDRGLTSLPIFILSSSISPNKMRCAHRLTDFMWGVESRFRRRALVEIELALA